MNYQELIKRAMGQNGLSANFVGQNQTNIMKLENKTFRFVLTNKSNEDLTFALTRGTFPTLAEIQKKYGNVKAILADGDFYKVSDTEKVSCDVDGHASVAHFQEFFAHSCEGVVTSMELISTEKGNFYREVKVVVPTPFDHVPGESVSLSRYLGTDQFDQNRLIADGINIPLSPLALVMMTILANSTITVEFTIDAQSR